MTLACFLDFLFPVRVCNRIYKNISNMKIRNFPLAFTKWFVKCWYEISVDAHFRRKRGIGSRRKVTDNTRPPKSWNSFLRCNKNKTELFGFLAEKIVSATITTEVTIVVTKEEKVVSNRALDTEFVSPCNHEEADTRMSLHAKPAALGGNRSMNIVSSDTDVVVIGMAVFEDLNVDALWVTFRKRKDLRWIPIHDIV